MLIIYCKQSWAWGGVCGNHWFGFILLPLNFTGMFDSYLFFMFWAHRACKFKYKPPDGSGRKRLVLSVGSSLKHNDNPVPFITVKTCCSCSTLQARLGQPHYFQKRHQPCTSTPVCRQHMRKGGGFEEHRGRAVLHSVTTGLSVSFVLFPRVQKQIALSILLLDTSVVSIPEQQYLERSLIISTLSFYTHMSLTQFRWSKHSGPVIFVRSMCTQSLALQGPSPMDNIKCFSDINAK